MFQLLLTIISFAALLLLLMPPTGTGVILTAALFAGGTALFVYGNTHKKEAWKNKHYSLVLLSALILLYFDVSQKFYQRWISFSMLQRLASLIHIPAAQITLIVTLMLTALAVYDIYILLQIIVKKIARIIHTGSFSVDLICALAAAVITVAFGQEMMHSRAMSMGYLKFSASALIVLTAIVLLYSLLGKIAPSIFIGAGIFMLIAAADVYVYSFRTRLLEPSDIFALRTALNVLKNYDLFPIPQMIKSRGLIFIAMVIAFHCLQHKGKSDITLKKRGVLLLFSIMSAVMIPRYALSLEIYRWGLDGIFYHGYVLDFATKFDGVFVSKPDNYDTERIAEWADRYSAEMDESVRKQEERPHVIVIMNESLSDLSVMGEFSTNMDVMPFISSLKENTVSGYALASVYGGNTSNSEYEFLTGNSFAWLSPNSVPYHQFINSPAYSMVSYLKSVYDYECIAMHPYYASGWNRPVAYGHLGFDRCYFIEDFPQKNYVRGYISDQEMFEYVIQTFEERKDHPLFIYGITMQNHGPYDYEGENYTQHISLNDYDNEFPEVEQYLSLIHETDKAVENLITYFQDVEEDVVIMLYGDHQPKLDEKFYHAIHENAAGTLDEEQKRYKVPFFIWANYDIEEEYKESTSLNYLSSYVYRAAGIALPPYNRFLQAIEKIIPSINVNGFYSLDAGCYLPFDQANDEEQLWLKQYEALQYNSLFDKRHRNNMLFPVLE